MGKGISPGRSRAWVARLWRTPISGETPQRPLKIEWADGWRRGLTSMPSNRAVD